MKDIKPLLILLLSVGLVGTWVYHLYDKTQYSQRQMVMPAADSTAMADAIRDSLSVMYKSTISNLDSSLSTASDSLANTRTMADSLRVRLQGKINEINRLKAEIGGILGKATPSRDDMINARQMIGELQQRVSELESQNGSMEQEKEQLATTLQQLTQHSDKLEQNIRRLTDENAGLTEKINQASLFIASDIHLTAINMRNSSEQETNSAKKADKFIVSFVLQNSINQYNNAEVVVVVIQPDRQVLQNSNWDSGVFDTKSEGRKSFTRVIKFDYAKGERKEVTFSLEADEFQKGNYILQVWHRGVVVGQSVTGLN